MSRQNFLRIELDNFLSNIVVGINLHANTLDHNLLCKDNIDLPLNIKLGLLYFMYTTITICYVGKSGIVIFIHYLLVLYWQLDFAKLIDENGTRSFTIANFNRITA